MESHIHPISMNRSSWSIGVLTLLSIGFAASCSSNRIDGEQSSRCMPGNRTCIGNNLNVCDDSGSYVQTQVCDGAMVCDATLGCVQCAPNAPTCVDNERHACTASGTIGELTETCAFGQKCLGGACINACEIQASDFVYLIDEQNNFLSFAPKNDRGAGTPASELFTRIGVMNCATTRPPYKDYLGATPFSMAVDRYATAWVLYTTGELFKVSPKDASCQPTTYQPSQLGWETFGMGYVSDSPGAKTDTLWIAHANSSSNTDMSLGKIDRNLMLSKVGSFTGISHSPEMTGTGNAELYGYFPSSQTGKHIIALINRTDASFMKTYQLAPLPSADENYSFAFAHWGGRFYYFIYMKLNDGSYVSRVYRYEPSTDTSTLVVDKSPYVIVGAGVSTCAPLQIG